MSDLIPISVFLESTSERTNTREQYLIKLSTPNGGTDAVLEVDGGWIGRKEDMQVSFVLPEGFHRFTFGYEIKKTTGVGGGNVEWANGNSQDATIHIHAWAEAFSQVRVRVFDIMGAK